MLTSCIYAHAHQPVATAGLQKTHTQLSSWLAAQHGGTNQIYTLLTLCIYICTCTPTSHRNNDRPTDHSKGCRGCSPLPAQTTQCLRVSPSYGYYRHCLPHGRALTALFSLSELDIVADGPLHCVLERNLDVLLRGNGDNPRLAIVPVRLPVEREGGPSSTLHPNGGGYPSTKGGERRGGEGGGRGSVKITAYFRENTYAYV